MIRKFIEWVRRLRGGGRRTPVAKPKGQTYHLLQPGTMRARCGARMGPAEILTVEARMVTCEHPECRHGGQADRIRQATSIR